MDSFEIDSEASFDSFHLNSEDFNIPSPHLIPEEFTKKLQDLEFENEKLRLSLENSKTEIVSLKASNQGLKAKIGELFQEAQTSLQEKLKLENNSKEKECQLAIIENSSKWYQARLHESEAVNKGLRMDLEAYQKILTQREQKISELIDKSEDNSKLRSKLDELEEKYLKERENWRQERSHLADNKMAVVHKMADDVTTFELKKRIAEMVHHLEIAEKKHQNVEISRNLAEERAVKCGKDADKMADDVTTFELEKRIAEMVHQLEIAEKKHQNVKISRNSAEERAKKRGKDADKMADEIDKMADDVTTFELKNRIAEMTHQLEIAEKRCKNMEISRNLAEERAIKCGKDADKMAPVHKMADDITTVELKKRIVEMVHQLEIAEKRYQNVEISRNLAEERAVKRGKEADKMADEIDKMAAEKSEALEKIKVLRNHGDDLRIENERLSVMLLASKKEKGEVEEGIVQLRLQLMKMIAQYKAVKSRSLEAEKRVKEVERENERLKMKIVAVNNSMMRKMKEERAKSKVLEDLLKREKARAKVACQKGETVSSMTICLQQALSREKELKERLKMLSKGADESVDEGYGDISGFTDIPLPSPPPINPQLLNFAANLIRKSQDFMGPVDGSLRELEMKIKKLGDRGMVKCR